LAQTGQGSSGSSGAYDDGGSYQRINIPGSDPSNSSGYVGYTQYDLGGNIVGYVLADIHGYDLSPDTTYVAGGPFPNYSGVGDYAFHTRSIGPYSQTFITDKYGQNFFVRSLGASRSVIGGIQDGYGYMGPNITSASDYAGFFTGSGWSVGLAVIVGFNFNSNWDGDYSKDFALGPPSASASLTYGVQVKP
jgi:hypothetical protein